MFVGFVALDTFSSEKNITDLDGATVEKKPFKKTPGEKHDTLL